MSKNTMRVLGQDLEVIETVVIQNPFVSGMLNKLCEEQCVLLAATGNSASFTRVDYMPYRFQLLAPTPGLERVPQESMLTRKALCSLLTQYGFAPINEG